MENKNIYIDGIKLKYDVDFKFKSLTGHQMIVLGAVKEIDGGVKYWAQHIYKDGFGTGREFRFTEDEIDRLIKFWKLEDDITELKLINFNEEHTFNEFEEDCFRDALLAYGLASLQDDIINLAKSIALNKANNLVIARDAIKVIIDENITDDKQYDYFRDIDDN